MMKPRTSGRKRRFGAAGILNVAATNIVLQALLATPSVSVPIATLLSQMLNTVFGYAIYGKIVFRAKGLRNHKPALKYLGLMTGIWLINSITIEAIVHNGINRNAAAAATIPLLAVVSYTGQKNWVFKS
jgi:putative flippase GtrA